MRIFLMARGGFSVFGGHYDAHRNEGVVEIRDGESRALTIEYPSAPTSPSTSGSGITASAPVVSGNKITTMLSAMNNGGWLDLTATVGGETRTVRVRCRNQTWVDRYDCGGLLNET